MSRAIRWIAPVLLAGWCCAQNVAQQIGQVDSPGRAEALGAKLLDESRVPAAAAAALWISGDQATRRNARIVLNEMEEAALDPLLKAKGKLDPAEQVWRMTMVAETVAELRRSAASMLDGQLGNKEPAPVPSILGAEERAPSRRVCDEAYVLMSAMLAGESKSQAFLLRMRQFRGMSVAGRDAEIQRARQLAAWRSLLNPRR